LGTVRDVGNFAIYPVRLLTSGKFRDLVVVISALSQLKYFVALQAYKISIDKNELQLEVNLFAYKNKNGKSVFTAKSTPQKSINSNAVLLDNPFKTFGDSFSTSKADITKWEIKDLIIVGVIKEHATTIAVIQDPLDYVYHVAVGDKVGLQKTRVLKVTDKCVFTENASQKICWKSVSDHC
jgi:Tfp pilus assembly protein PilP